MMVKPGKRGRKMMKELEGVLSIKKGDPVQILETCSSPHLWGKTGKYLGPAPSFGRVKIIMDDPDTATVLHKSNVYDLKWEEFALIAVRANNATEQLMDLQKEPNFVDLRKPPVDIRNQHHYARFKIQPVVFIMANNLNYEQGAIIKYIMRYDEKNGLEDLEKAKHYLDMMIQKVKGEEIKP